MSFPIPTSSWINIFLVFIFCASISWAQITSIKVNPTETFSSTNGVVYALPQVSFRVDVWVEKSEQLKGPYAAFANKLLGLDRIIDMNAADYKIKSIKTLQAQKLSYM